MLVEDLMTTNPAFVAPDDHLGAAAAECGTVMRRAPVVDPNGLVVGSGDRPGHLHGHLVARYTPS